MRVLMFRVEVFGRLAPLAAVLLAGMWISACREERSAESAGAACARRAPPVLEGVEG